MDVSMIHKDTRLFVKSFQFFSMEIKNFQAILPQIRVLSFSNETPQF
jgi:hypothetical protein